MIPEILFWVFLVWNCWNVVFWICFGNNSKSRAIGIPGAILTPLVIIGYYWEILF